jgi:glycerophosphoryl diester phosphodiesterase
MNTHESVLWVLHRGRRRFRTVLAFSLGFKLLQAALVAPIVAGGLRLLLQRWGRASVGNFEIASFLLSPPGLLAIVGIGAVTLAGLYLEWAGLMRLLVDERLKWWEALLASGPMFPRLIELGVRQLAFYLLLSLPFLAGIGGVYWWFWSGKDLNGLIILKPPEFWWGAALAAILAMACLRIVGRWFLRWVLAVPSLLFEPGVSVRDAIQFSTERMRGQERKLLLVLLAWLVVQLLLNAVVFAVLRWVSALILQQAGESLIAALPMTAGLLIVHGAVGALLSVFATTTFAGLVLVQYQQTPGCALTDDVSTARVDRQRQPSAGWMFAGGLLGLAAVTSLLSHQLLASIALGDQLEITAHRAGAKHAPENSVAAIRQAIRDRADWAEIDVQLTQDLQLVVLHDIDLARIGGGNRRVDAVTLAEIRALDIGTSFGPEFAGERVPTFDEILFAAGKDIRLNVELKPHGKDDELTLTKRVVSAIQQAGMVGRCRICSQSFRSLQHARRLEPLLPVGFIAGASIGDLAGLDVDFLMVKAESATSSLVQRAGVKRIPIHAWTVNDPAWLAPLLDRGVANIITDDPALMRQRWDEIRGLSPVQRLLLRARSELLGSTER